MKDDKMSWQYGLVKTKDGFMYLAEIYDGESHSEAISIGGESLADIQLDLEIIVNDLNNNLLIIDEVEIEDENI